MRQSAADKVIILGIDGMDPRITKHLMDAGKLPNFKKFVDQGAAREDLVLLGAMPTVTPPMWTTLATGAYPMTHGITCFFNQSPLGLDKMMYNLDSRLCKAEQLWNVTAEADKKTLVWHWPGSSWPPSSDSPNLHVVDGTQPAGSINLGIASVDWEKIVVASEACTTLQFLPHNPARAGAGCVITDLEGTLSQMDKIDGADALQLVNGGAKNLPYIANFLMSEADGEINSLGRVTTDVVNSPIKVASGWADAPTSAKEFVVLTSDGFVRRPALILENGQGIYDTVEIYRNKKERTPLIRLTIGEMSGSYVDEVKVGDATKQTCRSMKVYEMSQDGTQLKLWMSSAIDTSNNSIWHPNSLYQEIVDHVGQIPTVSLGGGHIPVLAENVLLPSWEIYCKWQAACLNYLAANGGYEVIFSHLHNVDAVGHQLWHYAKPREEWADKDAAFYQGCIVEAYRQTDDYLGEFLPLLEQGWTVIITSDHGLIVEENEPPVIGEPGGVNVPVMKELGYTVMKNDAQGQDIQEVDWSKTRAVNNRADHIWLNLKGRDEFGIVDSADRYELEAQIISDIYNYRDPHTGKRVISLALRNKDAVILGMGGSECGDIIFFMEEGFNRIHGESLSTQNGYFNSSVSPLFVGVGKGFKVGFKTQRLIRQVDVAPTVAILTGVRMPAQCEGAPMYQLLSQQY